MNKQIFDFLNEYAKLPSPQYAVLLRGREDGSSLKSVKSVRSV